MVKTDNFFKIHILFHTHISELSISLAKPKLSSKVYNLFHVFCL